VSIRIQNIKILKLPSYRYKIYTWLPQQSVSISLKNTISPQIERSKATGCEGKPSYNMGWVQIYNRHLQL
jgi:hypothetical protein